MAALAEGALLWEPDAEFKQTAHLKRYMDWLARERNLRFADYEALWRWSVDDLEAFWRSIVDFFDLRFATPPTAVLASRDMPGARWFPGAALNYAAQVFRHASDDRPAILYASETKPLQAMSWRELERRVASLAAALREMGVQPGDRVAAYLPNVPETVIAFLAVASIGATWSLCAPDAGEVAVEERFRQIEPKVLIAVDGYVYNGKTVDRTQTVLTLAARLPSVQNLVIAPALTGALDRARFPRAHDFSDLATNDVALDILPVPFDHPLWIVYTSGTTGMPKPIVHGHGGVVLEAMKSATLHNNIGPGDVFHWYTSCAWIMWNCQVGGLLVGATIALYDGSPAAPDLGRIWRFVEETKATFFGCGAAFFINCMKAGVVPSQQADLGRLRGLGSTGSPLPAEAYEWILENVRRDIWIVPISGGTDFAGVFVGGNPLLPVYSGEMQCRCLGAKVEAYDDAGRPVIEEVGELVCTAPMPSMPLRLLNDADGRRLRESYFDAFPGVWRHGDWIKITARGGAIIYGRSDATVNRHGIRMGSSEIYSIVESLPEVLDSLVVDLEFLGQDPHMALFVVLRPGHALDDASRLAIEARIRTGLSARHVPNAILQIPEVPRTLSGKKMEVPIKKLLLGHALDQVVNRGSMSNPASLDWFASFAPSFLEKRRAPAAQ
ncbi:MAG: acetoacetate--CoA ligase [Roseiarcus sp.]|jgi:acetoacetyl-CoA synthetase